MTGVLGPEHIRDHLVASPAEPPRLTLPRILGRAYRQHRDRLAVVDDVEQLTYAELTHWAYAIGDWLAERGVRPGDRVAFIGVNSARLLLAEQMILLCGFARVGLSPRLSAAEVVAILNDAAVSAVLADAQWAEEISRQSADSKTRPIVVALGRDSGGAADVGIDLLRTNAPTGEAKQAADAVQPDWLASLYYTSGTTGAPKGAAVSQEGLVALLQQVGHALPSIDGSEVVLHSAPLAHFTSVAALVSGVAGGTQRMMHPYTAAGCLEAVDRYSVTVMPLVPTMVNDLAAEQCAVPRRLDGLDCVFYVGAPIAPTKLRKAMEVLPAKFVQAYALTEAPLAITVLSDRDHRRAIEEDRLQVLSSAGRPVPVVEVEIHDQDGTPAPPGTTGEILVRSRTTMSCYWRNPEQTAASFIDGWLKTGDVGHLDDEGYLYITDRIKEMIVTGGLNVYPNEVESTIYQLDWIRECAVVGVPDEKWGEAIVVVAAIGARPPAESEEDLKKAIIDHCKSKLARYKAPKAVELVAELPKAPTGKVMRRAIREQYWAGRERRV